MGMIGNTPYQGIIQSGNIQDGAITTTKVADGAVTTAKQADANTTAAKLAASAVTDKLGFIPADVANQKRGLDFTGRATPNKHHHDWVWVQSAGAVLAPSQIPIYCPNIDHAESLAGWYLQRLFTELKTTENDSSWDGLHNYLLTYANVFSKIVSGGGAAPNLGTVDYDNAAGDNTTSFFTAEWFEVVIGSNGSTELYTMALAQGLTSTNPSYPTRILYQKTRNASDWRNDYPGANLSVNESAFANTPKCTTRSTNWTPTSSNPAIFLYPLTLELNF